MKPLKLIWVLGPAFLLFSCTKEEIQTPPTLPDFDMPLKVGNSLSYSVDSIVYNDFTFPVSVDTFHYFVKNEINEFENDAEGYANYKVSRFLRKDTKSLWKLDRVFRIRKNNRELILIDNNLPIVSLVFPVKEGKQWNGNTYNANEEQVFEYRNVQHAEKWGSLFFEHTLEVIQHQKINLLEDEFSMKQYASGIGLIKKQEHFFRTNFDGEIQSGYSLEYRLTE